MHLYLSQYWRIVPGRNIAKLTHRLQVLLDEGTELPVEFTTPCSEVQTTVVESVPDHILLSVEKQFHQSLKHLFVSFSNADALRVMNQPWIIVNHVVYLAHPISDAEWKRVIVEYIHRRRCGLVEG